MGTHPIFESDFDCLTEKKSENAKKHKTNGAARKLQAHRKSGRGNVWRRLQSQLHPNWKGGCSEKDPARGRGRGHPVDIVEGDLNPARVKRSSEHCRAD